MKRLIKIYHFLGGFRFALGLLVVISFFVIVGTFIESSSQSHGYAAQFTYGHPIFGLVLWLLFVNIFFAALRRWPFQIKHIPFLLTHLGLLLLLSGCLMKHYFGVQGSMSLLEGSGSDRLIIPESYTVHIEKRDKGSPLNRLTVDYPLRKKIWGGFQEHLIGEGKQKEAFNELSLQVEGFFPHAEEIIHPWIVGDVLQIYGLPPLPVQKFKDKEGSFHVAGTHFLQPETPWGIVAAKAENLKEAAEKLWLQGTMLRLSHPFYPSTEFPLKELLNNPLQWNDFDISGSLVFDFVPEKGFELPYLIIVAQKKGSWEKQSIRIDLSGPKKVLNQSERNSLGMEADLLRTPLVAFLQNILGEVCILCYGPHGEMYSDFFPAKIPEKILVYDEGFGSYAISWKFPYPLYLAERKDLEAAALHNLKIQLSQAVVSQAPLAPPLEMLADACAEAETNFAASCIEFLYYWDKDGHWVYRRPQGLPDSWKKILACINWRNISKKDLLACTWISSIVGEVEDELDKGKDLLTILDEKQWPLKDPIKKILETRNPQHQRDIDKALDLLSKQIYTVAEQLPYKVSMEDSSYENQAAMLSGWLRLYSVHLASILQPADDLVLRNYYSALLAENEQPSPNKRMNLPFWKKSPVEISHLKKALEGSSETLESPLTIEHNPAAPSTKLEENKPIALLRLSNGRHTESISLLYDKHGVGMKKSVLRNQYLVHFQPFFQEIPYRIRLRTARQICYPGTAQPYSYECDLLITDKENERIAERTISMNNVHETWDGYRFYLAGMTSQDGSVKRIQIVVNHDPGKYFLTYPGAVFLSLGIFLLFWMQPYKSKKNKT